MTKDQEQETMTRDELEYSITQYLDGTLDEASRGALEARLAEDPEARALLEEHRLLTAALRSGSLPQVRWDRLSQSIGAAIDDQLADRAERASWAIRMVRSPAYVALAASVLLAIGLAIHFLTQHNPGRSTSPTPATATVALDIQGPQEDQSAGPAVEEVSIGPGGSYAHASTLAPYADEIDTRPARVVVAAGAPVATEEAAQPSPF
jgi:anti-sigma factor RsiW